MLRRAALLALAAGLSSLITGRAHAQAGARLDRVRFGLDWRPEAEYGGYYQALATGLYRKAGLDVSIQPGGPQVNQLQLLLAGRLDLVITGNAFLALNAAQEHLPIRAVAAFFQKDPAVLIAHSGTGHDSFEALRGTPILIGSDTRVGWWNFLKARFGYTDAQIRPYTFNAAPFLADKQAVQQGYATSEPFTLAQAMGEKPVVLLLADAGFNGYASLVSARDDLIAQHPDVVQRFIAASIEGWRSYLNGDPAPAFALIKRENPEMADDLLAYARQALIDRGIVESGDALTLGIGAMTDARWASFAQSMAAAGLYPAGFDPKPAYTLAFVDKKAP